MAIWSSGKGATTTKKYQVKIKGVRLEVEGQQGLSHLFKEREWSSSSSSMAVEVRWPGPTKTKTGISSLYKVSHKAPIFPSSASSLKEIKRLKVVSSEPSSDFDDDQSDEFDHVCNFSVVSSNPMSFAPWIVTFYILKSEETASTSTLSSKNKMQEIAEAELDLAELAPKMQQEVERKIYVALHVNGVVMKATLRVVVSFIEMRGNSHSRTASQDSSGGAQRPIDLMLLRRAKSQGPSSGQEKDKKSRFSFFMKQWSSKNLNEPSAATLNAKSEYVVVASTSKSGEQNSVTELGSSSSSEAQLDLAKKGGFWKWKRRKSNKNIEVPPESSLVLQEEAEKGDKPGIWEVREFISRDGKTKLKAYIFFASFDQRGEKAAGESACAAIVAVTAHWFQKNPGLMPTGSEFDNLITEGSSEWRKLCNEDSHKEFFPDQHFDLETILRAGLRPLAVCLNHSRIGFFHPEKFEHLKDALSFDDIWDEINRNVHEFESRVYIVRWNDHFFVMIVGANVNYIVDSFGERLYEGCNQAYILKFDDSSVMYEMEEGGVEKEICKGKGCCKEYMKRFLAAIPLRELQEQEEMGKTVDMFSLYQRLQIDFHLSTPPTTANTSASVSPNIEPEFLM